MRRADAEAILGEKINGYQPKNHYSEDYVMILEVPGLADKVIYGKPLIVVHPGFSLIYDTPYGERVKDYETYWSNLNKKINEAIQKKRTILIIQPARPRTTLLPDLNNVIWVPDPFVDVDLLTSEFYKKLSKYVDEVDIAGELRGGCLLANEGRLEDAHIKVNKLEDCIFPKIMG